MEMEMEMSIAYVETAKAHVEMSVLSYALCLVRYTKYENWHALLNKTAAAAIIIAGCFEHQYFHLYNYYVNHTPRQTVRKKEPPLTHKTNL